MKYAFIAAALAWSETPDTTEGLFLQPEEAAKIDSDLQAAAGAQQAVADLAIANNTIAERDNTIAGLNSTIGQVQAEANTAAQASQNTLTARDQRIAELEAQVAELGKQSSGRGTSITVTEDEATSEKGKKSAHPRFDSPEHPANQLADKFTRKK